MPMDINTFIFEATLTAIVSSTHLDDTPMGYRLEYVFIDDDPTIPWDTDTLSTGFLEMIYNNYESLIRRRR